MERQPGDYQNPEDYPMAVPFRDGVSPPFYTHSPAHYGSIVAKCKHPVYVLGMFSAGTSYACKTCLTYPIWPRETNPVIEG